MIQLFLEVVKNIMFPYDSQVIEEAITTCSLVALCFPFNLICMFLP